MLIVLLQSESLLKKPQLELATKLSNWEVLSWSSDLLVEELRSDLLHSIFKIYSLNYLFSASNFAIFSSIMLLFYNFLYRVALPHLRFLMRRYSDGGSSVRIKMRPFTVTASKLIMKRPIFTFFLSISSMFLCTELISPCLDLTKGFSKVHSSFNLAMHQLSLNRLGFLAYAITFSSVIEPAGPTYVIPVGRLSRIICTRLFLGYFLREYLTFPDLALVKVILVSFCSTLISTVGSSFTSTLFCIIVY